MKQWQVSLTVCAVLIGLASSAILQGRQAAPKQWKLIERDDDLQTKSITFTFNLRQCNLDQLEQNFWEISNPKHSRYAQYMSLEDINELVMCSGDRELMTNFLDQFPVNKVVFQGPAIKVTCSVAVAEEMLNTKFFNFEHKTSKKIFTRQLGSVELPEELNGIVTFVSGISEFFHDSKYAPIAHSAKPKPSVTKADYNPNIFNLTDPYVTLNLLHYIYGLPTTEIQNISNTLGIAAFDNDYDDEALCRFQDLFNSYEAPPTVVYMGPEEGSDQVESDLDVQYSTAVAKGATEYFDNHPNGEWILDWAQQTVQDDGRATVWSLSYGWPEIYQCTSPEGNITECPTGYNYQMYINATNQELMKLGSMGVSVMVSSGDDGTPGFASNCPLDPTYTIDGTSCLDALEDGNCQCAELIATYSPGNGEPNATCIIPNGFMYGECADFNEEAEIACEFALNALLSATFTQNSSYCNMSTGSTASGVPYFFSNCSCSSIQPTEYFGSAGSCTIQGYSFNIANGPAFLPDFPTSSPYVTSVGATAMQYSTQCSTEVNAPEIYCEADDAAGFSGGGGFSSFQTISGSNYQIQQVQKYLSLNADILPPQSTFNPNNRAYPDVAFNGHNYIVAIGYSAMSEGLTPNGINGAIYPISGTSASSPAFAGMVAHLNDVLSAQNLPRLGFLNQLLYQMSQEAPETFNDIVPQKIDLGIETVVAGSFSGCTQEYCCQYGFPISQGWDPATGLGTPNFEAIANYLQKMWADKKSSN
eukprot:TRINITY_DN110_c0_g1_i1.p1 TRINITY_DN110_c0_g1~~TRINITY_DN110_c0_g1_i1.p1  ORF type:complete len:758 (-),score=190.40 TRINITY_DN110_c0_g1_i1:53-2326(-)